MRVIFVRFRTVWVRGGSGSPLGCGGCVSRAHRWDPRRRLHGLADGIRVFWTVGACDSGCGSVCIILVLSYLYTHTNNCTAWPADEPLQREAALDGCGIAFRECDPGECIRAHRGVRVWAGLQWSRGTPRSPSPRAPFPPLPPPAPAPPRPPPHPLLPPRQFPPTPLPPQTLGPCPLPSNPGPQHWWLLTARSTPGQEHFTFRK